MLSWRSRAALPRKSPRQMKKKAEEVERRRQRRARKREAAAAAAPDPDRKKYAAGLLAGLFPALMVFSQVTGFNGPYYWRWNYSHDSILPFLLLLLPAGLLVFWARRRFQASQESRRSAIAMLVLTQAFLLFSYVSLSEHSIDTVERRIRDADITSYYSEALAIHDLSHWISHYDQLLPHMRGHTTTHPPGGILFFYFWIKALGDRSAALWAGIAIGLVACLAVPAIYLLTQRLTRNPESAFASAAVWAALPGIIVIFPSLDQIYPVLTILLLYFWEQSAIGGRLRYVAAFVATLFCALLFSHSFLLLGAYFVLSAAFAVALSEDKKATWRNVLAPGAIGLLLLCGLFAGAYWLFGYNHVAALRQSIRIQEGLARTWGRPYHLAVFWDLYDFFLASGWIFLGILAVAATRWKTDWSSWGPALRAFAPAALGCLLIVDLSGLLRTEAARVWLFLQPLVVPLVAAELGRWSERWQRTAYGLLLVILAVIRSRLNFL